MRHVQTSDALLVYTTKWMRCALCPRTKILIAFCNSLACARDFLFSFLHHFCRLSSQYIFTCWVLLLVLVCSVYRLTQNMNWNYSTLTWLTRSVELLHKNPSHRLGTHMMRWIHTHAVKPPQWLTQPILAFKMIRWFFFLYCKLSLIVLDISSIEYGICLRY